QSGIPGLLACLSWRQLSPTAEGLQACLCWRIDGVPVAREVSEPSSRQASMAERRRGEGLNVSLCRACEATFALDETCWALSIGGCVVDGSGQFGSLLEPEHRLAVGDVD